MSLKELIAQRQVAADERLTVELEFLPGFLVTIAHMTRQAYESMSLKAEEVYWEKHQKKYRVSEQKLAVLLAEHVVTWRGLTMRLLSRMLWLKINDLTEAQKDEEITHTPEEVQALLLSHKGFSTFVVAAAMNVDNFSEALEGAEKNLPSGSASGPSQDESTAGVAASLTLS
jgi:hypothetical protein